MSFKDSHSGDSSVDSADPTSTQDNRSPATAESGKANDSPTEYGGRKSGLDPTRYGDWEKNGRCIDF
jgi:hypothetical protein